jgi:hypothetical protein
MTMRPPHDYIPIRSSTFAPPGTASPAVRMEAFKAALEGIPTGAYDDRVIAWLCEQDDPTAKTVVSLMWRCRETDVSQQA